jgi:HNH endonuclease
MSEIYIPIAVQRKVLILSNGYCEYCLHPESHATDFYHFDHINPFLKIGRNAVGNIARSCGRCNIVKSQKTHAIDPLTNDIYPLFHPRKEIWTDHFQWSEDYLIMYGLTPTGRATIDFLQLNRRNLQNLRGTMRDSGLHPPKFSIVA